MEYTLTGDLQGGGSATINTTITGLKGKPLPELSAGALTYSGTDWVFGSSGGGELSGSEISITSATTGTIGRFHRCSGTTGDYTITLPTTVGNGGKQIAFLMDSGLTKLVTLQANGSETIDGSNTRIMWANESCVLRVNDAGTMWEKIGGKTIPMSAELGISGNHVFGASALTKLANFNQSISLSGPSSLQDLSNNRLIAQRPGKWLSRLKLSVSVNGSPNYMHLQSQIYKNGVGGFVVDTALYYNSTYVPLAPQRLFLDTNAGDYFEPYGVYYSGTFTTTFLQNHGVLGFDNIFGIYEVPTW